MFRLIVELEDLDIETVLDVVDELTEIGDGDIADSSQAIRSIIRRFSDCRKAPNNACTRQGRAAANDEVSG